jgi:carboxypeptidase family protein
VRLVPASEIRGHVIDAAGAPVAGAKVYLISKSRGLGTDSDETDTEGRYAFSHLFSDEYVIQALAPAEAATPPGTAYPLTSYGPGKVVTIGEGDRLEDIDVVLKPAAVQKVKGRIHATGKLRGARVEIRPLLDDAAEVVRHRGVLPEADGSFVFDNVAPGKYVVRAKGSEILWTMGGERESAVSGEKLIEVCQNAARPVLVEMRPPIHVRGRVKLEDGVMLSRSDVSVSFRGREMPWRVYGVSATPGAVFDLSLPSDGSYAVSVVLGKGNHYLKSVRVGRDLQSASEVRLPAGVAEVEAELLVSPKGAQIEIERPAGVSVYDLNAAVFVHGKQGEFERSLHALIDGDGGVRVHAVPPGHHRVLVWVGEDPPCAVDGATGCAGLGEWVTVTEAARLRVGRKPGVEEVRVWGSGAEPAERP